jgi:DNA-binding transcriptional LysR family regulator
VGLSQILLDRLLAGALDLAVLPMRPTGPKIRQVELADVEFAWMCHPEMEIPLRIAAKRLSQYPLLGQTNDSGLQRTINRWLRANGAFAKFAMTSNSVNVLCSLSAAGLGLSCLPISQFYHHVNSGRLKIVETTPSLPKVTYYIGYKDNAVLPISALVANVIRRIGGL